MHTSYKKDLLGIAYAALMYIALGVVIRVLIVEHALSWQLALVMFTLGAAAGRWIEKYTLLG